MMRAPLRWYFLALLLANPLQTHAQAPTPEGDSAQAPTGHAYRAVGLLSAYYAGSLAVLSRTWYRDRPVVRFHFYDDNGAYLQVDKAGHAFGAYVYSYAGYHYLRGTGVTRREALVFGAGLGLALQTPIEIMDGFHEGYGFSWGDMAANATGSAVVLAQELLFGEQVAKLKFSYWESSYARNGNGYLGSTTLDRLFTDYNGHTYWVSLPLSRLLGDNRVPSWLNVAAGYGADGMYGEFENAEAHNGIALPDVVRFRQFLVSLDVDWTRIETDSRLLGLILKGLTFVKLPFPAIEYSSTGYWRAHLLYF